MMGEEGLGCWGLTPSSTPPVCGALCCLQPQHGPHDWTSDHGQREGLHYFGVIVDKKLGAWANVFITGGLSWVNLGGFTI